MCRSTTAGEETGSGVRSRPPRTAASSSSRRSPTWPRRPRVCSVRAAQPVDRPPKNRGGRVLGARVYHLGEALLDLVEPRDSGIQSLETPHRLVQPRARLVLRGAQLVRPSRENAKRLVKSVLGSRRVLRVAALELRKPVWERRIGNRSCRELVEPHRRCLDARLQFLIGSAFDGLQPRAQHGEALAELLVAATFQGLDPRRQLRIHDRPSSELPQAPTKPLDLRPQLLVASTFNDLQPRRQLVSARRIRVRTRGQLLQTARKLRQPRLQFVIGSALNGLQPRTQDGDALAELLVAATFQGLDPRRQLRIRDRPSSELLQAPAKLVDPRPQLLVASTLDDLQPRRQLLCERRIRSRARGQLLHPAGKLLQRRPHALVAGALDSMKPDAELVQASA